ncbi:RHS repeat-associated core domain-containing protein [Facilibium subflavum]|uniref:RHS repeat-associated core domain-containing protein n=1 Tax=Facilibium subflavum TaxID=2219058 RepID=UPI000E64CF55|nr:RHS repeat-associated core domain-containing protein [Facilibium subflavum]
MKQDYLSLLKTIIFLVIYAAAPRMNFAHPVIAKLQHVDFYLTNGKSNKAMLPESNEFSTSQQKLSSTNYTAYGKGQKIANAKGFGYNREYTDENSNLVYLRARFYHPATQTFITRDTKIDEWNKYGFTGGNPVMNIDPSGHDIFEIFGEMAQRFEGGDEVLEDTRSVFNEIKTKHIEAAQHAEDAARFIDALSNDNDYHALIARRNNLVRNLLKGYKSSYCYLNCKRYRYNLLTLTGRLNIDPDNLLFNDIRAKLIDETNAEYMHFLHEQLLSTRLIYGSDILGAFIEFQNRAYQVEANDDLSNLILDFISPEISTPSSSGIDELYQHLEHDQWMTGYASMTAELDNSLNNALNKMQFYYFKGMAVAPTNEFKALLSYRTLTFKWVNISIMDL